MLALRGLRSAAAIVLCDCRRTLVEPMGATSRFDFIRVSATVDSLGILFPGMAGSSVCLAPFSFLPIFRKPAILALMKNENSLSHHILAGGIVLWLMDG